MNLPNPYPERLNEVSGDKQIKDAINRLNKFMGKEIKLKNINKSFIKF